MQFKINEVIWIGLSVCALSVAVAAVACDDPDAISMEDLRLDALDPAMDPQDDALARPAEVAGDENAWHHGIGGWHGGHNGWHGEDDGGWHGGHNGWHGEDDGGWHGWHGEDDGGWHGEDDGGWHGRHGEDDGGWHGEDDGGWGE